MTKSFVHLDVWFHIRLYSIHSYLIYSIQNKWDTNFYKSLVAVFNFLIVVAMKMLLKYSTNSFPQTNQFVWCPVLWMLERAFKAKAPSTVYRSGGTLRHRPVARWAIPPLFPELAKHYWLLIILQLYMSIWSKLKWLFMSCVETQTKAKCKDIVSYSGYFISILGVSKYMAALNICNSEYLLPPPQKSERRQETRQKT